MSKILLAAALVAGLSEANKPKVKEIEYCGLLGNKGLCEKCQGDCDSNADCDTGLKCHQRRYGGDIPGCTDSLVDPTDDFCVEDSCANFKCSTGWKEKTKTPSFSTVKGATNEKCCDKLCSSYTCPTGWVADVQKKKNPFKSATANTDCCKKTCATQVCKSGFTKNAANTNKAIVGTDANAFCCKEKCSNQKCKSGNVEIWRRRDETFDAGKFEKTCCRDPKKLWDVGGGDMGCSFGTPFVGNCQECEGDCDVDTDCATGLKCFQRKWDEKVPGCNSGGTGDVKTNDYCYKPPATKLLYSEQDEEAAAAAPASASVLPYVGALAMVSLVAFVYIRASKSHSVREPELAEGNLLTVEQGGEDETLE